MKKQMNLIYVILTVVLIGVLALTAILFMNADADVSETTTQTTESQTTSTPEDVTADTTDTQSSSETTSEQSAEPTISQTTYPPATVPNFEKENTIGALDPSVREYLMSLDNTNRGWGMGPHYDEKNRPLDAVNAQKNYSQYGSSYVMDDNKIYLTFDEGYENGYTAKILDVLKEKKVKAVFFITMSYAKNHADLVQRMIDEGHIVGNHSTNHKAFPTLSLDEAYEDVKELHDYVYARFGYTMKLFRFPEGVSSDRMQALLKEMGYTSVFWSFAYRDWESDNQPEQKEAFAKITERLHPGAIYLLHAVSSTNTELLPYIIDDFRLRGYELALYPIK